LTSPGSSTHQYWTAICEREIAWISKYAVPRTEDNPLRQEDSQEDPLCHIQQLKRCVSVAPLMTPPLPMSVGTLWHEDLNFRNIMVSTDINPRIISIIDWQNTSIGPLYLQFREPQLFDCINDYINDCESLDKQSNRSGTEDNVMAKLALEAKELRRVYFESITKHCPYSVEALSVPYAKLQKNLMFTSGRSWTMRNKILSLRNGLLNLWCKWAGYGFKSPPPFSVSLEEANVHFDECEGVDQSDEFVQGIIRSIGMSHSGEVNVEEYQDKKLLYEDIKQQWIGDMSAQWNAQAVSKEKIKWEEYWPFRYPGLGY
jgi:hypothetical protein